MRSIFLSNTERARRQRTRRGNFLLLAMLIVASWLAVIGAASVVTTIGRWLAS